MIETALEDESTLTSVPVYRVPSKFKSLQLRTHNVGLVIIAYPLAIRKTGVAKLKKFV